MLSRNTAVILICFLGIAFSVMVSWLCFEFSYFEPDGVSYLFQAKLFTLGKLYLDAPPEYGFSSSPHINILEGKWYSKYPFGNALMLTLGEFVDAPWVIPALVTGFALVLLYLIVRETYGVDAAILAAILGLISPATLGMGSTWLSEPVSRFFLAVFLFCLICTLKGGRCLYPVLSGFALGYAFNTRPMSAVAFGVAAACFTLYWLVRSQAKILILKSIALFFIPFTFMMGLCLLWNAYLTGDPIKFTFNAAQPYDRVGFGMRGEGYDPDAEGPDDCVPPMRTVVFTPKLAVERIWRHTIPCILYNAMGWGYYRPDLLRHTDDTATRPYQITSAKSSDVDIGLDAIWRTYARKLSPLRLIPLTFPIILMLIPLIHPSRNRYDVLFFSFLVLNLLLYFPFYFDGCTRGATPVHARYYNECTLLGIIPLVSRGMFILYGWMRNIQSRLPFLLICALSALLIINTVYTYMLIGKSYRKWSPVYQQLPRLVKHQGIYHAVVFIPNQRGAPIGDYPFRSLEEADIVYFKLGPCKVWRLTSTDWRNVYETYFMGRSAYMYENGQLNRLI